MRCLSYYRGIYLESLEVTMKRHKIAGVLFEIRSKDFLITRELYSQLIFPILLQHQISEISRHELKITSLNDNRPQC